MTADPPIESAARRRTTRVLVCGNVVACIAALVVLALARPSDLGAVAFLTAGAIAVLGAATLIRVRAEELRLAEEHARAVDALARSERRRAEVERLAAAGSTAARVAHDMSNPLASIRVNLDWLHEEVERGRLDAEADEVREVLRETRECVDRLGANLADFRAAARVARAAVTERVSGEGGPAAPIAHIDAPENV